MPGLTIRWTMGDWPGRRFHPQAWQMLAHSVAWAARLFPDATLVIATNNLTAEATRKVAAICDRYGAAEFKAEPWLPRIFDHAKTATSANPNDRNTWWKLSPLRLAPDCHELILDNDVVLWRVPPAVLAWLASDRMMLGAGDDKPGEWTAARQTYGSYSKLMAAEHPDLTFNSGIIGWPPGCTTLPHPVTDARLRPHYYATEQGYLAMNWITWPGPRGLVPWASVPAVNDFNREFTADRILAECDGGHFTDHNVGRSTRFADEFARRLYVDAPDRLDRPAPQPIQPVPLPGAEVPCTAS